MAIQYLDDAPGGDLFQDLYDKFNHNADEYLTAVTQADHVVTLTKAGGGTFHIDLPPGTDRVLTGLVVSVGGSGPFTADYAAGTYQLSGVAHAIAGGALSIPAANATLDRLDAVVVDDTETVLYLAGSPAAAPAAPTVASNQLLLTYLYVAAASEPLVQAPDSPIPAGLADGDTLHWQNAAWRRNPNFTHDGAIADLSADASLQLRADAARLTLQPAQADLRFDDGAANHYVHLDGVSIELGQAAGDPATVFANVDGGLKLKSATPAGSHLGKLWQSSSTLRWEDYYVTVHTDAAFAVEVTTTAHLIRDDGADAEGGFETTAAATRVFHTDGPLDAEIRLADDIEFRQNGATEVSVQVNVDGGLQLKDNTPAAVTDKLYQTGGVLFWSGAPVCLDPCGGGDTRAIVTVPSTPYAADPAAEQGLVVNTGTLGAAVVTLPASPDEGASLFVTKPQPDATVTIDGNGHVINGVGSSFVLRGAPEAVWLAYSGGAWHVAASHDTARELIDITASTDSPYTVAPTRPVTVISVLSNAASTVNLPAAPHHGQQVIVKDRGGAALNNITVDGGAANIDATGGTFTVSTPYQALELQYSATAGVWQILSK